MTMIHKSQISVRCGRSMMGLVTGKNPRLLLSTRTTTAPAGTGTAVSTSFSGAGRTTSKTSSSPLGLSARPVTTTAAAASLSSANITTTPQHFVTPSSSSWLSSTWSSSSRTSSSPSSSSSSSSSWMTMIAVFSAMAISTLTTPDGDAKTVYLESLPAGADIIMTGTPVKEKATGILFPQLCNGFYLAGTGVRVKYGFINVYAVGTYLDIIAMDAVKKDGSAIAIQQALLDPSYPRTIRIVMNRGLSIEKYTAAIVESLEPRMKGQDLDKLEEFKKMNPPIDLVKGAVIEMTIRGDTMLYKDATGSVNSIRSIIFTRAMCDVYYGNDAVSPTHKQDVIQNIPNMK